VDWCTSEVKNCELVGNQVRADVCSTATDEVRSTRESLPNPRHRSWVSRAASLALPTWVRRNRALWPCSVSVWCCWSPVHGAAPAARLRRAPIPDNPGQ